MKLLALVSLTAALAVSVFAAEPPVAGPKGGRLLASTPQRAEFFVTPERRVEITFYDAQLQPASPTDQQVTVIAEPKAGRSPVALEKTAAGFRSTQPLPESDESYRLVVQVRETADARPQNFRIDLHLAACAECQRAEYACTCESH